MTFYYYILDDSSFITHDGYMQLGFYRMSIQEFLEKSKVNYIETNWVPDVFTNRYKRLPYQVHLKEASIGTKDK